MSNRFFFFLLSILSTPTLHAQYGDAYHSANQVALNQMAYDRGQKIMNDHYKAIAPSGSGRSSSSSGGGISPEIQAWADDFVQSRENAKAAQRQYDATNGSAHYKVLQYAYQNDLQPGRETWDLLWDMARGMGMDSKYFNKHFKKWQVKKRTQEEIAAERKRQDEEALKKAKAYATDWQNMEELEKTSDAFDKAMQDLKKRIGDTVVTSTAAPVNFNEVGSLVLLEKLTNSYVYRDWDFFNNYYDQLAPAYVLENQQTLSNLKGSMVFVSQETKEAARFFKTPFQEFEQNVQAMSTALSTKNYNELNQYLVFAKLHFTEGSGMYAILTEGVNALSNSFTGEEDKKSIAYRMFLKAKERSATKVDFASYLLLDLAVALSPKNEVIRNERYVTGTSLGKKHISNYDTLLHALD